MSGIWVALLALFGTLATGAVTWAVARRSTSGSIRTSEATTLWAESQALRKELREEVNGMRKQVAQLSTEVRDCHAESLELQRRLAALEAG